MKKIHFLLILLIGISIAAFSQNEGKANAPPTVTVYVEQQTASQPVMIAPIYTWQLSNEQSLISNCYAWMEDRRIGDNYYSNYIYPQNTLYDYMLLNSINYVDYSYGTNKGNTTVIINSNGGIGY